MLNVEILRNNPMADGVESIGRLDVNMGAFIQVSITQELGQSTEDATSQKLLTDTVKDISNEINSLETELTDTINTKSAQLSSSIDDEVANRKADSVAIRTEFAHADTMNKEALTALINTKEISLRSEVTNYVEELQSDIDAESVVRKAEDATIRSEFAQADQKLKDSLIETVNARDSSIRNDFNKADSLVQVAVLAEEDARKAEDKAIRGELSLMDQSLKASVVSEEGARKAEDTAIRGELEGVNQLLQSTIDAESVARKAEDIAIRNEYATKNELTQAITDLINGADVDSDTLKELADKITALAQADKGLVSATEAQSFSESNKEIARKNIDAVSNADFEQSVTTINSTKADRTELTQAKTELIQSIQNKGVELQAAIDGEQVERKSENTDIRSELALADQSLKDDIEAKDAAIRSELTQTSQQLQEAISAEEGARLAEVAVIRSEFTQADQELKEAVDAEDASIRRELSEVDEQLQVAIDAEKTSREAAETAINEQIATKADKAPEGEEYALVSAIPDLTPYATKVELTRAITDLINGADADSDTLKELADKITALAQADNGLVSATSAQTFQESNKEIARKNIDAVSKATFEQAVATINSTKADKDELSQAKTDLTSSIKTKSEELQDAISAEEDARTAEGEAIRSEFAQANQTLRQAVDESDEAIRGEVAKVNQQLQEAINAEQVARQEADTTINEQIDTKADKAPEGQEYALVSAIPDLTPYTTKVELTQAIADLINGADVDSDTLKELADKITALAQADKGLVSTTEAQSFSESNKEIARGNIGAVSTTTFDEAVATINSTKATHEELEQAKTELADSIQSNADELIEAISTEEEARKAESEAIRGEFTESDQKIKDAIESNYAKKSDLTPYATKAEVVEDIGDIANLPTNDKTSVVASISELFSGVNHFVSELENTIDEHFALKSELTPLATKIELTQAITDLINGADADSDTLKELADKITALAQADNGLVNALEPQDFNETQKQQARDNIDAAAKSDIPDVSDLITKAESDTNYHNKAVTYTRTEMDSRYYTKTTADSTFAKVWTGTLTEYNAITAKDDNTIYIVT